MTDDVRVVGLAELHKALQALPAKIEANVMRAALAAGARVVRDKARTLAPSRTGRLRKSIRTSGRVNKRAGKVEASIKAGKRAKGVYNQGWYATIVHQGAKPHIIKARTPAGLRIGDRYVGQSVQHPGFRAVPFLADALKTTADAAVRAIGAKVAERLKAQHGIDVPAPADFDELDP